MTCTVVIKGIAPQACAAAKKRGLDLRVEDVVYQPYYTLGVLEVSPAALRDWEISSHSRVGDLLSWREI